MHNFEGVVRDVRHACRLLARRPAFAVVAVTTIGVGLAATTLAFALINGLFFKGAAGIDQPGFGSITTGEGPEPEGVSFREYEAFARDVLSLELAAAARVPVGYADGGSVETLWTLAVSRNYFDLPGVQPDRGSLLAAAAPGTGSRAASADPLTSLRAD